MGYRTEIFGEFVLDKKLKPEHKNYLEKFAETRRVRRIPELLINRPNPILHAAGLPIGEEGAYFVDIPDNEEDEMDDPSICNYSAVPKGQPHLYCDWTPSEDGSKIVWLEADKSYGYIEWIQYLSPSCDLN